MLCFSQSNAWNCSQFYGIGDVLYGGTSVIMDTLGPAKCPDYQGVLIFQVSLHDNVSFGTTARCVDYGGVHIFK